MSAGGARVRDDDDGADEQRPKRIARVPVGLRIGTSASAGVEQPSTHAQRLPGNGAPIYDPDAPNCAICSNPDTPPFKCDVHGYALEPQPTPGNRSLIELNLNNMHLLDCPVCFTPLAPPVIQCENGHVACLQCCGMIHNRCPSCYCPIGHLRCTWAERLLESLIISCKYAEHGCMEKMRHHIKFHHESSCKYASCSCPHDGCGYIGMSESLVTHFAENHHYSSSVIRLDTTMVVTVDRRQKKVFLLEEGERQLFVLNYRVEPHGCLVNVVCIAPTSSGNKFMCEISATDAGSTTSFRSRVVPWPKLIPWWPMQNYFTITKDFASYAFDHYELKLIIRRG